MSDSSIDDHIPVLSISATILRLITMCKTGLTWTAFPILVRSYYKTQDCLPFALGSVYSCRTNRKYNALPNGFLATIRKVLRTFWEFSSQTGSLPISREHERQQIKSSKHATVRIRNPIHAGNEDHSNPPCRQSPSIRPLRSLI